jgi:hypothetical protein
MTVSAILYFGARNDPCMGFQGRESHHFDAEQKRRLALGDALSVDLFLCTAFRVHAPTPAMVMLIGYSAVE